MSELCQTFCCCCYCCIKKILTSYPTRSPRSSVDIQLDPRLTEDLNDADDAAEDIEESTESPKDVYVGGPAAVCAAALQAQFGRGSDVLYCHDGQRGLSNWKGSASYFHVRDAVPVYYWPDNHGAYSIYVTAKHALQRRIDPKGSLSPLIHDDHFILIILSHIRFTSNLGTIMSKITPTTAFPSYS